MDRALVNCRESLRIVGGGGGFVAATFVVLRLKECTGWTDRLEGSTFSVSSSVE